jgi:hypothetical protein
MISNLDANSARGLIGSTHYQPFNHHSGLFVNKHLFFSTTGTILTMKMEQRAADDGGKMSEDEWGKFRRRETGRFSLTHYENFYGEAKSLATHNNEDVPRGAWRVETL